MRDLIEKLLTRTLLSLSHPYQVRHQVYTISKGNLISLIKIHERYVLQAHDADY
jgi:hypothetical protein